MTHNKQVSAINDREFDALDGAQTTFSAEDSLTDSYILKLLNSMLPNVPQTLNLKIKAQVMLTRNLSVSTGLVNGSRGIVTGFDAKDQVKTFWRLNYLTFLIFFLTLHRGQSLNLPLTTNLK